MRRVMLRSSTTPTPRSASTQAACSDARAEAERGGSTSAGDRCFLSSYAVKRPDCYTQESPSLHVALAVTVLRASIVVADTSGR